MYLPITFVGCEWTHFEAKIERKKKEEEEE